MNFNSIEEAIEWHIEQIHILFREEGISKPLDKSKWREYVVAKKIGHEVHKKASAGALSEQYGSDATDTQSVLHEYKSKTLSPRQEKLFDNGSLNATIGMVYNGAYKEGAIEAYKRVKHKLTLFSETTGKLVAVIEVPTKEVVSQLQANLENMQSQIKAGKKKTTNCNTVYVRFNNGAPNIGKVVWKKSNI